MQRRAWLQALTNQNFSKLAAPFSAEFDGKRWDCAGTGPALLMLLCEEPSYPPGGPDLSVLTKDRRDCGVVDIDMVRDWSFTPEEEEYCEICGGGSHVPVNEARMEGILINRALLYRFIPPGASGAVRLFAGETLGSLLFDGGDWRLYLMCMYSDKPLDVPEWPNG